jgi:hypothetical protein
MKNHTCVWRNIYNTARATHSRYYKYFAKHACDFSLILLEPCNFLYQSFKEITNILRQREKNGKTLLDYTKWRTDWTFVVAGRNFRGREGFSSQILFFKVRHVFSNDVEVFVIAVYWFLKISLFFLVQMIKQLFIYI